jgi:phage tail-like protein
MPRHPLFDHLQNHRFFLFDASWSLTGGTPWILNPLAGFSAISTPEITIETEAHNSGNAYTATHLISGGTVGQLTLSRGVSFLDKEFWNWFVASMRGQDASTFPLRASGKRRDLVLMQLTNMTPGGGQEIMSAMGALWGGLPSFDMVTNVPGFLLKLEKCLPVRYKPTSDLDATNSDISIQEITLQPKMITQL